MNEKHKTGKRSPVLIITVVTLATIALSVAVFLLESYAESRRDQAEIQKRLDAIRAAGEPLTAQDMAKLYPDPPPEHDAVLLLKPALSEVNAPEDSTNLPFFSTNLPTGASSLGKPMMDEIQLWIGKNREALRSAPLEKIEGAWIGSGFSGGFTNITDIPASDINSLARLFCLNVILQAESGHSNEALHSLQQAFAIASAWQTDSPIDSILRTYEEKTACESLEYMINHLRFSEADLTVIEQSIPPENTNILTQMFLNLRCFQLWQMERIGRDSELATTLFRGRKLQDRAIFWFDQISGKIYRNSDLLLLLNRSAQRIAATKLPFKECMDKLEILKPGVERDGSEASLALRWAEGDINRYTNYARGVTDGIAYLRTDRAAIAVERWRLAHNGRIPDSLNQLVPDFLPAVPTDPFDGKPLRYKKLAHGYVVYSIGHDFTDDGGKEEPADADDSTHYDITFTVGR